MLKQDDTEIASNSINQSNHTYYKNMICIISSEH